MSQQNGNGHVNGKHNGPDFSALQEKALFAAQRAVDAVYVGWEVGSAYSIVLRDGIFVCTVEATRPDPNP